MSATVYVLGILLQALAGMTALLQVRHAPRKLPWLLIAISALLIVYRRAATLGEFWRVDRPLAAAEMMTLLISFLFMAGVLLMSRMFRESTEAHSTLQMSEERLRLAHKATNDVVWDWDIVNDMQRWNESGTAVFGWTEIVQRPVSASWWVERVHPDDRQRVDEGFFAVVNNPSQDFWQEEYRFRKANGSYADVMDRGYVMRDPQGKALRMVGAMHDITERKHAAKQALQLKKNESLGRLAGAIAHSYNNLMSVVLGNLELAMDEAAPLALASERIAEAVTAAKQAAEVSGLMLAYLGQGIGKPEAFDLSSVCRATVDGLGSSLSTTTRLTKHFPSQGPNIRADRAQIAMIVTNLLANANDAIGEVGGDIVVAVAETEASAIPRERLSPVGWAPKAERYACLSVADTGCGIDQEHFEVLFEPFFSTKQAGKGLGLAVVLGIVNAYEGAVVISSKPKRGTVFRVFLPLTTEKPAEPAAPSTPSPASPKDLQGSILVVDDERLVLKTAQRMLESIGYEVVTASDGPEAVEIYSARMDEICCVLCDLTMPKMNGWETLAALRKLRPEIPVILSSGYDESNVRAHASDEHPQAFLSKPYDRAALKNALSRALVKHRAPIQANGEDTDNTNA